MPDLQYLTKKKEICNLFMEAADRPINLRSVWKKIEKGGNLAEQSFK